MLCALSRWMISRAADTGKTPPRVVERHLRRCRACAEYARFASSLPARFTGDKDAFLAAVPDFPLGETAWAKEPARANERTSPGRRFALRPVPAVAGILVVVAAAFLVYRLAVRGPGPTPEELAAGRAALQSLVAAPNEFEGALTKAESSLVQERRILEKSIVSAAEYLQARLNIKVERKGRAQDL
jgi:hypothetical protein